MGIGDYDVKPFSGPVAVDADLPRQVRGNDNVLRQKFVDHQNDTVAHNQFGDLADRPATAEVGSVYYAEDTAAVYLYGASGWILIAGGGASIGGSGTPGKLSKWVTSTTLTDSLFTESGTTISTTASLTVGGDFTHSGVLTYLAQGTTADQRAIVGAGTGLFGAIMTIRAPDGYGAGYRFNNGTDLTTGLRWQVYKSGDTESGGASGRGGANYLVRSYDNSGGSFREDLNINRSTGAWTIAGALAMVGALTGVTTAAVSTSVTTPLITNAGTLNLRTTGSNALTLGTNTTTRITIAAASGDVTFTGALSGITTIGLSGVLTHTGTAGTAIVLNRTSNSINSNIQYQATGGSVYAGQGAALTFAVGGSGDLTSSPWLRVTSTAVTASSFVGALTGNATTATTLATARDFSITGDGTASAVSFNGSANVALALTLATVNVDVGAFGSSTSIPTFTVNAKGLITAASGNAVIAPAGTLTGTTLASNVVTSSLTTIGALIAGAVPASLVTAGTFGTGAYTFPSTLGVQGVLTRIGTSAIDGSAPVTLVIRDQQTSSSWTPGASFARLGFWSEDGSAPANQLRAAIDAYMPTATGGAGGMRFYVANTSGLVQALDLASTTGDATLAGTLTTSGGITVNYTSGTALAINASASGSATNIIWQVAGVARWILRKGSDAESGGDAGSPLELLARTDLGASIDTPITINRAASGTISIVRPMLIQGTYTSAGGFRLNSTITATGGVSRNLWVSGTQNAAANSDTLHALQITTAFSVGAFTGTEARGLTINNITGAATNYAIYTGTGLVRLGDVVAVGAATPSTTTALITPASTTSVSSLRLPHGVAPSAPVDGDVWTTTTGLFARINGATVGPYTTNTGDVVGPGSATDNAVALFDTTTGKLIKNSVVIISAGAVSGVTSLAMGGALSGATSGAFSGDVTVGGAVLAKLSGASSVFDSASAGFRGLTSADLISQSATNFRFRTIRSGGTLASPSAVTAGMVLGSVVFTGYDGTSVYDSGTTPNGGAYIYAQATENWNSSNHGTGLVLAAETASSGTSQITLSDSITVASGGGFNVTAAGQITFQTVASSPFVINDSGVDSDFRIEGDTLAYALFLDAGQDALALFAGSAPNFQSGKGIAYLANATTVPTGDPTGGGFLYAEAGALKWRGSGGTITTIAVA